MPSPFRAISRIFAGVLIAMIGISVGAYARAADPAASPRVVGYFAEWNEQYSAKNIPGDLVTDVIYTFARLKDGGLTISKRDANAKADAPHASVKHFSELKALKAKYPTLRTLVSVGGWGAAEGFSEVAADEAARRKFGQSCAEFLHANGFDGIDIDWEFPGENDPADAHNFTLLLAEVRTQFDVQAKIDGHAYQLTIAASAGPAHYDVMELGEIQKSIDWINLMGYDLNGGWSPKTDFNAALFSPKPIGDASPNSGLSIDAAVQAYLKAGVPKEKIVVGVPFYGQAWSDVGPDNHGLFQPHGKDKPKPPDGGDWTYRTIRALGLDAKEHRHWNDVAKVPWAYDPAKKMMISYDDPQSMQAKGAYVKDRGLGGVMIWELSEDDGDASLLKALVAGVRGEAK